MDMLCLCVYQVQKDLIDLYVRAKMQNLGVVVMKMNQPKNENVDLNTNHPFY